MDGRAFVTKIEVTGGAYGMGLRQASAGNTRVAQPDLVSRALDCVVWVRARVRENIQSIAGTLTPYFTVGI